MLETQKSAVNAWECDENAHLNVQFYWKRFDDAGNILAAHSGQPFRRWTDRHVRYHAELLSGAITTTRSMNALTQASVHVMTNVETGAIAATAVDRFEEGAPPIDAISQLPEASQPRSLPVGVLSPQDKEKKIAQANGLITHLSVISPAECDRDGILKDQFHISRFSEAASHYWNHLGISVLWLLEQKLGSVAVEMKVTRHALPRSGMITEVVTWLESMSNKAFTIRHQVRDTKSDTVLYSGAVTVLLISLETRRAVALPDSFQKYSGGTS